ncbi:MAG: hypothetical protein ABSH22_22700 [Tepidisphaeraceae bacterium]|jgi:hypothetical protein
MKKLASSRVVMCERLESRQLLSAALLTIETDSATLQTEGHTLSVKLNAFLTNFSAAVPAGTAGRKALRTDINVFESDLESVMGQVTTDLSILSVDAVGGGPSEAAAIASLKNDIVTGRTALKADASDIKNLLIAHPTLIIASAKVIRNDTQVNNDFTALKADVTTLKTDLS